MFGRLLKSVNRGTRAEGGVRRRRRRRVRDSLFNASGHLINDLTGSGGRRRRGLGPQLAARRGEARRRGRRGQTIGQQLRVVTQAWD